MAPTPESIRKKANKVSRVVRVGSVTVAMRAHGFALGIDRLDKDLRQTHSNALGQLNRRAEEYFRANRKRPWESGDRPGERMTGRFTFGNSGAFKGTLIQEETVQGFAFPDVKRADRFTDGVWRVLEWGLGELQTSHPMAPRGQFKMPIMKNGKPGRFYGPQGQQLLRPAGKAKPVAGGIEGKLFLTRAWNDIVGGDRQARGSWIDREYRRITTDVSMEFDR